MIIKRFGILLSAGFLLLMSVRPVCSGHDIAVDNDTAAEPEFFVYDDKGLRDPLWPLVSGAGIIQNYGMELILADLTLEGIVSTDEQGGMAIINGKVVRVGDRVGQYVVNSIQNEKVIFMDGDQKLELRLQKGE